MNTKRSKKIILYGFLFVAISAPIYLLGSRIKQEDIIKLVQSVGVLGPIIYILLYALTGIIAPLSATPIFLAGYVLFKNQFLIYSYIGVWICSVVNFWIARKWGRSIVIRLVGEKNMNKIDSLTENHGIKSLIFLRIFLGYLGDFVSYAYGLTNIRFLPYIVITIVASLPWLLIWQVFLLDRIANLFEFTSWFIVSMIPFWIISILFFAKLRSKKSQIPKNSKSS
jgi:uncharacterized membrane protein YdjX (TVP38/TMEM64 family)